MDQQTAKTKYQQASALFAQKNHAAAFALLEELLAAFPDNAEVRRAHAQLLSAMEPEASQSSGQRTGKRPLLRSKWVWVAVGGVGLLAILAGVLLVPFGRAFEVREEEFPLSVGHEWIFRGPHGNEYPYRMTGELQHNDERMVQVVEGRPPNEQVLFMALKDGALYNYWDPEDDLPAEIIAKFPLHAGVKWTSKVLQKDKDGNWVRKECRWATEEETIEVPAGTYHTIRVDFLDTSMTGIWRPSIWVAPDVGFVQFVGDGFKFSLVRHSFNTEAKKRVADLAAIAGRWAWFTGIDLLIEGNGSFTIVLDGDVTVLDAESRKFRLVWQDGKWVDTAVLSEDGKRLSARNQDGETFTGERIGSYDVPTTESFGVAHLVGQWRWGDYGAIAEIGRDGSIAYRDHLSGAITPDDAGNGDYVFTWPNGRDIDTLALLDGGQRLEGRNQSGAVVTGVRIAETPQKRPQQARKEQAPAESTLPPDPKAAGGLFIKTLRKGSVKEIRALLDQGADPNYLHEGEHGPRRAWQVISARMDRDEVYQLLISHGVDVTLRPEMPGDWGKFTLAQEKEFFEAVAAGNVEETRRWLEQEGMDPDLEGYSTGVRPLHMAAGVGNMALVRLLLEFGADVNGEAAMDYTGPLFGAVRNGHTEIVRLLVAEGADVNAKSADGGWTPLSVARESANKELIQLLEAPPDTEAAAASNAGQYAELAFPQPAWCYDVRVEEDVWRFRVNTVKSNRPDQAKWQAGWHDFVYSPSAHSWNTVKRDTWNRYVSPLSAERIIEAPDMAPIRISADGGQTWAVGQPFRFDPGDGQERQRAPLACWSLRDAGKYFLFLYGDNAVLPAACSTGSDEVTLLAPLPVFGHYRADGDKHWFASYRYDKFYSSADDFASWREEEGPQSPWSRETSLMRHLETALPVEQRGKTLDPDDRAQAADLRVDWIARTGGSSYYAGVGPVQGLRDHTCSGVFVSNDDGQRWARLDPQKDLANCPLIETDEAGVAYFDVRGAAYDRRRAVLFVRNYMSACHMTADDGATWKQVNTPPK